MSPAPTRLVLLLFLRPLTLRLSLFLSLPSHSSLSLSFSIPSANDWLRQRKEIITSEKESKKKSRWPRRPTGLLSDWLPTYLPGWVPTFAT
ncbi:hypothetical protein IWX49DRAFT_560350 [Phyllosticta citricarpa]